MRHLKRLSSRGDTIVEIMIVLAVLGLALSISYATANRSLLNARQAQENSEATELLQSQIESLITLGTITNSSDPNYIFGSATSSTFCVVGGNVKPTSNPLCQQFPEVPYAISISRDPQTNTFTATATWPDVNGGGQDTVTLAYRVHLPNPTGGS